MKKRNTTSRLNSVDYTIFILCSIGAIAMFYLFYQDMNSFSIKQDEKPVAFIYERTNNVQRKFSNRNLWEKLINESDIYDGDTIRTDQNSYATCAYHEGGIKLELDENSMIQILQSKKDNSVNFISGEIKLLSTDDTPAPVIKTGLKKIEVSANSEIKISVPEQNSEEVVVEVISGTAEISNNEELVKTPKDEQNTPKIVKAGNTAFVYSHNTQASIVSMNSVQAVQRLNEKKPVREIDMSAHRERTLSKAVFYTNTWGKEKYERNHQMDINLPSILHGNRKIPAGSVIELTFSGTPDHDVLLISCDLHQSLPDHWEMVSPNVPGTANGGDGFIAGEPFEMKKMFILEKDIVNTDFAAITYAFDSYELDEALYLTDCKFSGRIVTKDVNTVKTTLRKGYNKTISLDNAIYTRISDPHWGNSFGLKFFGEELFGNFAVIEKGTRVKITISGTPDEDIHYLSTQYSFHNDWTDFFSYPQNGFLNSTAKAGEPFSTYRVVTAEKTSFISDICTFQIFGGDLDYKDINIEDFSLTVEIL